MRSFVAAARYSSSTPPRQNRYVANATAFQRCHEQRVATKIRVRCAVVAHATFLSSSSSVFFFDGVLFDESRR